MKFLTLVLLLNVSLSALAQTVGSAQFLTTKEDSISFIKEELTQRAFKNIIDKEFETLQLNAKAFWDKLDLIYQEQLEKAKESLEKKYKIGEGATPTQVQEYNKVMRSKKLLLKRNIANLDRVITSYVIRSNTRSASNPSLRLMSVEAKVNRGLLNQIYHKYVHGNKSSDYGKLYISVDYNLVKMSFSDLGVRNDSDFTGVVNEYWEKWFKENKPQNISDVIILDESDTSTLSSYSKIPAHKLNEQIPSQFRNSLLLKIAVNIKNKNMNKDHFEYKLEFSGSMFLTNMQTGQILESYTVDPVVKDYRLESNEGFSSIVANHLYRRPLGLFPSVKRKIKDLNPASKVELLRVINIKSMGQLNELLDLFKSRLVKYSVDFNIESLTQGIASVNLVYEGEKTDLINSLKIMNSAKMGIQYDVIESDELVGIKLK